jgi:hypothetical protein
MATFSNLKFRTLLWHFVVICVCIVSAVGLHSCNFTNDDTEVNYEYPSLLIGTWQCSSVITTTTVGDSLPTTTIGDTPSLRLSINTNYTAVYYQLTHNDNDTDHSTDEWTVASRGFWQFQNSRFYLSQSDNLIAYNITALTTTKLELATVNTTQNDDGTTTVVSTTMGFTRVTTNASESEL